MKFLSSLAAVLGLAVSTVCAMSTAEGDNMATADIYIQAVSPVAPIQKQDADSTQVLPEPFLLTSIRYFPDASWEPPNVAELELPKDVNTSDPNALYRVGIYDPKAHTWLTSTTIFAAPNLAKGYCRTFTLTLDGHQGEALAAEDRLPKPLAVTFRGIDSEHCFGPRASIIWTSEGKTPILNKPVVLNPEGKKVEPPQEKTFLQKYWWMIAIAVMVMAAGGGDQQS